MDTGDPAGGTPQWPGPGSPTPRDAYRPFAMSSTPGSAHTNGKPGFAKLPQEVLS